MLMIIIFKVVMKSMSKIKEDWKKIILDKMKKSNIKIFVDILIKLIRALGFQTEKLTRYQNYWKEREW